MSTPASPPNEVEPSPLKRFRTAKGELHAIFEQLSATVTQLHRTLEDASGFLSTDVWWVDHKVGSDPVVQEGDITEARKLVQVTQQRTRNIIETVKRDTMKAVFFGRTSNGKSTLINAMLGNRILPSGIGHTTNCFCRIRGVDEQIPYILSPEDGSKKDLSELKKLAHALYSETPEEIKTAEILWPRHQCKLLQDYVEILDSPGLDISEENDKWIDLHCKDADILVLVANSESALNMTERRFIGHVHKKLVDPSVFICFNRWDCMDDAECDVDHKDGVKKQHLESALNLLLQELESDILNEHLPSVTDANNRIFLLSAKEALVRRVGTSDSSQLSDQVEQRYTEFQRFESNFEQSMSFSAMNKRFESHVHSGVEMAQRIGMMLGDLCQRVEGFQASMSGSVVCAEEDLESLRTSTSIFEKDLPNYIEATKNGKMQDNLQQVLKTTGKEALEESLHRFNDVNLFNPEDLQLYQRSIEKHLVKDLTKKLVVLCDDELQIQYASVQQLISESNMSMILKLPRFRQQYPGSTLINLNNITDGFKPNVAFRFSFGRFETRWNEFTALSRTWVTHSLQQYLLPVTSDPSALTSPEKPQSELSLPASFLQSNGVFIVLAGGLSYFPSVGKLVEYGLIALAVCYGYQYLTYTKSQQMETFKTQLKDHAASKLFDLAPQIAYYNTQEWTNQSSNLVDIAIAKAKVEETQLILTVAENEQRLSDLNKLNGTACRMRHRADDHVSRLQRFEQRYLGDLTWRMPPMSPLVSRSK